MRRATRNAVKSTESAAPFDLTKVKTTADSSVRKGKRIFGLQEAPTFYPTKEEFQDPLAYIEKISPEGEKYGIIKIVPPQDYHPEFSLKTENFRFRTRIQKLNSMEGETRTNVNYLEQLTKYHIQNGRAVSKIPQLDKRPIDLYKLKNEVALRGGVQEVTRLKKWAEIGRILGYTRKQCTSLSNSLKTAYTKWVLPYEIWYAKHKDDVDQVLKKESTVESDTCEICQKIENQDQLLLCDGCNRGYHMYCLKPPLSSVPKTEWYCLQCLTAVGKDYGFEDGDEYSLEEFRQFSDKFKKEWFSKSLGQDSPVTEEVCENEFWRLVEDPHEKCQVEYGADLHSTQHGSGFMAAEQMPKGAFDPWNLNVIPVAPQSLFTHIKTDISGMMVPWLYVGMCFSAFCWHNEDHYTFSINYMHWGETKTWYGVPGSDTAKFEETMRKAVPELFEQQPDLLFQLVTMLSPGRLLQENVNVYAVDQRPGQFVVTYPKAYHSGFNHGFNFCEAVNFAPGDWVDHGLECVKLYKAFRKQPCFSHDELLITAAQHLESTENIDWLQRGLAEMQTRELKERKQVRSRKLKEEVVPEDKLVEELQCDYCHCFTYLSYIGCKCTDKVVCHEHISELCTCDISSKTMYSRFTDQQLKDITKRIVDSGSSPDKWIKKLDQTLVSRPSIKAMKDLLKEGREINAPQDSLDTLKDCIETVDQWTSEAEKALNLKYDTFRNGKRRYHKVNELIERASSIGFETPYLDKLKAYKANVDELDSKLSDMASNDTKLQLQLYEEGLKLRADSPRFLQLMAFVESSSWDDRVQKAFKSPFNLKNIRKLIKDAEDMGMDSESGPLFNQLTRMEEFGKQVLQQVDNICRGREKITVHDEKNIVEKISSNGELSIILDPQTITRLKNNLGRSRETLVKIEDAMATHSPSVEKRLPVAEAQRLLSLSREISFTSPTILELSNEIAKAASWNDQVRRVFMNGRQKSLETTLKEVLSNVERITSSDKKSNIWCVCRKPESGLMVECDVCREWYHNTCLKVARNAVRSTNSYVCPICCPSENDKKITHISRQPEIEEIKTIVEQAQDLRFCPKEYVAIRDIYRVIQEYKNRVQAFCRSRAQLGMEDVSKIKDYLRELTGLEVLLQDETDFLKSKIQALVPIIACVCQNTENKNNLVVCSECQRWSHADCVNASSQFVCSSCNSGKRPAEEVSLPSKPNKIIKLTVKPPVFDSRKRHHAAETFKKQKSVA